jgi:hypothetical protein
MSFYIHTATNQQRQFNDDWFSACVAAGNPKVAGWAKMDPQPQPQPSEPTVPQPHRVSKDTIVSRISSAGKVADLMALIAGLSPEQQFLWDNYSWFNSDNQIVVQMCQQIGLDPAVILAVDPYI